ncbi:hypothetical protein THRCLA_21788 [Thraustotheca clavata]|uniref:Uncharacterized protein n=1 Tax=Thraustotheca clavata TaxID=74557 RepID=A0A1V9ZPC6_9STRA|nr:hypothetical protein THRCLA_21788 [Thraustotheca clavata]
MASPQEEKLRVYNEALLHAASCRVNDCNSHNGRCHKIRVSLSHFKQCYSSRRFTSRIEEIEECKHCSKIFGLLYYHAKTPHSNESCHVHMCDYLRRKMNQQDGHGVVTPTERPWTVERRIAQAEEDRRAVLLLLQNIVRQKYERGEEIEPYYHQFLYHQA